jgi:hypothetical protein
MLRRITVVVMIVLFALQSTWSPVNAQDEARRFFSDTGHWLVEQFYDFYMDYEHAEIVYGSPITDQYVDKLTGRMIQYFQNVRFELHPENPPGLQVVVTPLGDALYVPGEPIHLDPLTPNCRQAMGWAFPVCFSFLDYYRENGGQARFGAPISGMEFTKGHLVQHFKFARLMWNPDHPEGARVTLAPLGEEYFSIMEEDLSRLTPERNHIYSMNISELNVRSFTRHAMVSQDESQTLYVMVRDQNAASVIGARVTMTVEFPDGSSGTFMTVATNDLGLAEINFPVVSSTLGLVKVTVSVVYADLYETSVTSFRIWY